MREPRQVTGLLLGASAVACDALGPDREPGPGVLLSFGAPQSGPGSRSWERLGCDRIDDFAALGEEREVDTVLGLARVIRVLRAARVAPPADPYDLLGDPSRAARLLARASGTPFVLWLRPRASVRFTAWTERGVASIPDVVEVAEEDDSFWVRRRSGAPLRVERSEVTRTATECRSWYEVAAIDRAG